MLYRSKLKWIKKYIEGKKVLDLGCVCHELGLTDPPWLHGFICEHAAETVGVDLLKREVDLLEDRGYRVFCADVEKMDIGDEFDVIVAGDIIEHVANPGMMLERVADHLVPDGVFLVTTPNPLTLVRYMRMLFSGRLAANKQHVTWFTSKVLRQLAARYGFEMIDESYTDDTRIYYRIWPKMKKGGFIRRTNTLMKRLWWRPCLWLNTMICLLRPRSAETLCMAFRKGTQ